ncbi:MAG: hypothetical protein U0744_12840 [Gemmataceae bacterium]
MMRSFVPAALISAVTLAVFGLGRVAADDTPARPQPIPSLGSWLCLFGSPVLPSKSAPETSSRSAATPRSGEEESEDGIEQLLAQDLMGTWGRLWNAGEYRQAADVAKQASRLAPKNNDAKHALSVAGVLKALQANAATEKAPSCCSDEPAAAPSKGKVQVSVGLFPFTIEVKASTNAAGIKAACDAITGAGCCTKSVAAAKSCCAENKCCGSCKACAKAGCTEKACAKACPCCNDKAPKDCACPRESKDAQKTAAVRGGCCEGEVCPLTAIRPALIRSIGQLRIEMPPMPQVHVGPMPRVFANPVPAMPGTVNQLTFVAPAMPAVQGFAIAPPMPMPPVHMTQTPDHTHIVGANFDAFCRKATMLPGCPCVMMEGNVQMTTKRNGQSIRIEGQRIIVNVTDGTFTAESDSNGVVGQTGFLRRMPMGPIAPAIAPVVGVSHSSPIQQAVWIQRIEEMSSQSTRSEAPRPTNTASGQGRSAADKQLSRYELLGPAMGD